MALALRFDLPAPPEDGKVELEPLWATHYYLPEVAPAEGPESFPLRDMQGGELGVRLSRRDWCDAALQGSILVRLAAGPKVFNYAGTTPEVEVDCAQVFPAFPAISRTRFGPAGGPYGDGVGRLKLVPFRSWAVDERRIPHGAVLFVPDAVGTVVPLPGGGHAAHDGYFFAADKGGAIKGNHVDVFIGPNAESPFEFISNRRTETFRAYRVDHPPTATLLKSAHGWAASDFAKR